MKYYIEAFKKYAVFSGRSTRKEYWMFYLFNIVVSFIIGFIAGFLGVFLDFNLTNFFIIIYSIIIFIPSLAIFVRRAHDSNNSGWFMLVPIYNFILLFLPSTPGDNKYGPNPDMASPIIHADTPITPTPGSGPTFS